MRPTADSIRRAISARALSIIVFSKLFYIAAVLINLTWLPDTFRLDVFLTNFHWPLAPPTSWRLMLNTWDTNHYLFLSEHGYIKGQMANAMYPLWPYLIHVGNYVFHDSLVSGMILSNLLSVVALMIFREFAAGKFGPEVADRSLILLVVFPGSLFYFFAYSESVFLFLSVLFFYLIDRRNYVAASAVTFFCPLAKAIGIFIVIPLFLYLWKDWRAGRISFRYYLSLLLPWLGYGTVFLIVYYFTGNPAEQFEAQGRYIAHATISKVFMPIRFVNEFFSFGMSHDLFHSPIDRLWFGLSVLGLYLLWKTDRKLFFYALPITIVPAMSASLMSFTRYAAVIFPLFIVYGEYFSAGRKNKLYWITLFLLAGIHVVFVFKHMNNYWVA